MDFKITDVVLFLLILNSEATLIINFVCPSVRNVMLMQNSSPKTIMAKYFRKRWRGGGVKSDITFFWGGA